MYNIYLQLILQSKFVADVDLLPTKFVHDSPTCAYRAHSVPKCTKMPLLKYLLIKEEKFGRLKGFFITIVNGIFLRLILLM
jgi:hypothetical protein